MVPACATHGARAVPTGVATSCHPVVKSFSKLFAWRLPSFNHRRSTRVYHGNVLEERRTTDYQRAGETSRDEGTPRSGEPHADRGGVNILGVGFIVAGVLLMALAVVDAGLFT